MLRDARPSPATGSRCRGAHLIVFIKAWTESEGKKDQEILAAAVNPQPRWPWSTTEDFADRLAEAGRAPNTSGRNEKGAGTHGRVKPNLPLRSARPASRILKGRFQDERHERSKRNHMQRGLGGLGFLMAMKTISADLEPTLRTMLMGVRTKAQSLQDGVFLPGRRSTSSTTTASSVSKTWISRTRNGLKRLSIIS